jgi:hypothetical protein
MGSKVKFMLTMLYCWVEGKKTSRIETDLETDWDEGG